MQSDLDTLRAALPAILREGRGENPNTVRRAPERLWEQADAAQSSPRRSTRPRPAEPMRPICAPLTAGAGCMA